MTMQTYIISKGDALSPQEIILPPTKSVFNRSLTIEAIRNSKFSLEKVSGKDAEKVFNPSIRKGKVSLVKGEPAKAIRFLSVFLSYFGGEWIVSGTKEMMKRPVEEVIAHLSEKGHNIRYVEREGFPPLKILGKGLQGSILRIDATICSEFVSTSLHISKSLSKAKLVKLKDWVISSPYINQTLRVLSYLGVNSGWKQEEVLVEHKLNDGSQMEVEGSWLNASYWYQIVALAKIKELKIKGLQFESLQSDSIAKELFELIGVNTMPTDEGVVIRSGKPKVKTFQYDFSGNTDLIPTIVLTCVGLKMPFRILGIEALRNGDTDRIMALQSQMLSLGVKLKIEKHGTIETMSFDGKIAFPERVSFDAFKDHRILMPLASLSATGLVVEINNPRLVSNSYPGFWNELEKLGLRVEKNGN